MIGAARAYARESPRLRFATRGGNRTNRKDENLRRQENDADIAMLMTGIGAGVIVIRFPAIMMMVMMRAALVVIAAAELNVARQRIGKMHMVLSVVDPVHQRDIGLARQHDR